MRPSVDIDGRSQLCSVHATRLRGGTPEEQLLAISDVFHDWFQEHEDYDGCSFQPALCPHAARRRLCGIGNATEIPTGGGPRLMLITMTTHLQHTRESDGLASACTSHQPS